MIDEKKLIECLQRCVNISDNSNFTNGLLSAIDVVNQQPKIGVWIPCSEQLPDDPIPDAFYGLSEIDAYPEYIVMISGAEEPTFLKYLGNGEWYRDKNYYKVIAWMPLPEPYKEE